MLIKAKTLSGYKLSCLDGEIGHIKEFYFDDLHWAVRYLVVGTRNWLASRQVLISPFSITSIDAARKSISINLTKRQIEESPSILFDLPVTRTSERDHAKYYGWPIYWEGPYALGSTPRANVDRIGPLVLEKSWDANLRSTKTVCGYHVDAEDGAIGHIDDVIIDDETWILRYVIIDTRNWITGKKVLVSPMWISRLDAADATADVDLAREDIRNSPEYHADSLLSRDYETILHEHYRREGYWADDLEARRRT